MIKKEDLLFHDLNTRSRADSLLLIFSLSLMLYGFQLLLFDIMKPILFFQMNYYLDGSI